MNILSSFNQLSTNISLYGDASQPASLPGLRAVVKLTHTRYCVPTKWCIGKPLKLLLFVFPVSLKVPAKHKHSSSAKHIVPLLLSWSVSAVVQEEPGRCGDGSKRLETLELPLPYMDIQLPEAIKAKNFSSKDQMTDNGAQTLAIIG